MNKSEIAKRLLSYTMTFLMAFTLFTGLVPSAHADVTNTYDVTKIYTIDDLYNVRNNMAGSYILMNDIDMTEATAPGGKYDFKGNGWNPIGSYEGYSFNGVFDGNGHTIKGMRIHVNTASCGAEGNDITLGLFSAIGSGLYNAERKKTRDASIKNLNIADFDIYGEVISGRGSVTAGAIAGTNIGGVISSCHSKGGKIEGKSDSDWVNGSTVQCQNNLMLGGIVGNNSGVIKCCSNSSTIKGYAHGKGDEGTSYYKEANCDLGGIAGALSDRIGYDNEYKSCISECYNTGKIECTCKSPVGEFSTARISGIAPDWGGTIINCYNTGRLSGSDDHHNISCDDIVGAFCYTGGIGMADSHCSNGVIRNCYNTAKADWACGIGATNCYFLFTVGGAQNGATPLTSAQMKNQSSFEGFDFNDTWFIDSTTGHPYPQLINNPYDVGKSKASSIASVALDKESYEYTGSEICPSVSVIGNDGKKLTASEDYTVTFENNTNVGTAKAIITGTGKFKGTYIAEFRILPENTSSLKVKAGKKYFQASWNEQGNQTTGYIIQYSLKKDFSSPKYKTVTGKKITKTIVKSLKSKKKYYVRIATYKDVNGVKYHSSWSKTKTLKIK